jgi:hypothetical protein
MNIPLWHDQVPIWTSFSLKSVPSRRNVCSLMMHAPDDVVVDTISVSVLPFWTADVHR